jgi:hypothetical protein
MYLMQKSVGCCFWSYFQTRYAFNGGRKKSKNTITALMYANVDESEKMPLLVTGKQEK